MVTSNNYKLAVKVQNNELVFYQPDNESGNYCSISFHRTLRIPDDGKIYPLPPSLGTFPICKVDDYLDRVPEEWKKTGGVFFPLAQREAMWMSFKCSSHSRPKALKIGVGKVNAINGQPWSNNLHQDDYVTIPKQPWLDGINAGGKGTIRQFVAMPLGSGYSVEAQVTGEEKHGGLQIMAFDPYESKRLEKYPPRLESAAIRSRGGGPFLLKKKSLACAAPCSVKASKRKCEEAASEMSLSAGGSMKQEISKDPFGINFWDQECLGRCYVRIVNSTMYEQITGKKAPPTPITAQTYTSHGYPWFDIYNENPNNSIDQSTTLNQVKSVKQMDQTKYSWPQQDDSSVSISAHQVKPIPKNVVRDGEW